MNTLAVVLALLLQTQEPKPPEPPKQEKPKGLEFTVDDWKIKFYGFLRLDIEYDTQQPNNTQTIIWVKTPDPAAPAAVFAPDDSKDLTIHPRLTRLGIDVTGPPISMIGDAKVMGKIEIDFYNNGLQGQSESREAIRMRHAYVKLSWDDISVLAGQTADVISPIYPAVNADIVMWGAGNLGDRRPMIMADYHPKVGDGNIILQGEVGLTGADDNQNIDGGVRDGEASGFPTLQARVAYKGKHLWLDKGTFEVGVWGHYAKEHFDTLPAGFTEDDFTSTAFGVDLTLPILDWLEVRGEIWQGKNVDDVRGGIFQPGVNNIDGGTEMESRGYWAEMMVKPATWYALHLGISRDNPVNSDVLAAGTFAGTPVGQIDNKIYYLANRFNLGGGLTVGLDYFHWVTQWRFGLEDGVDNRFDFFVQWSF